jgi:hypothetical protein
MLFTLASASAKNINLGSWLSFRHQSSGESIGPNLLFPLDKNLRMWDPTDHVLYFHLITEAEPAS